MRNLPERARQDGWKWTKSLPRWKQQKLQIKMTDLKEECSTLMASDFKSYHGMRYVSVLYHDDMFGTYITKIKINRVQGLKTDNARIMKHRTRKAFLAFQTKNKDKLDAGKPIEREDVHVSQEPIKFDFMIYSRTTKPQSILTKYCEVLQAKLNEPL